MQTSVDIVVTAIIDVLLDDIAPLCVAEIRADPKTRARPGLSAAADRLEAWLTELSGSARETALAPARLDRALRAAFLSAAGCGRILVSVERATCDASLEMAAISVALVETIRELAATLDAAHGSTVADDFDMWRDGLMAQMFARARDAAASQCDNP